MSFEKAVRELGDPDFPFKFLKGSEDPVVFVPAGEYYNIFNPIFEKFGIYGNGPDWDGLIIQAVDIYKLELDGEIDFNSEGDACMIYLQSDEDAMALVNGLKNIFNNEKALTEFLKKVDTSLLDG